MASWQDSRRKTDRRVNFWVTLLVLIGSVFALGWWVGAASASPPPVWPGCERVYQAPPFVQVGPLRSAPLHPALLGYARCVRDGR